MKFILNFAKGSLFAAVLLGVVYSPFTAEAESQKTFAQKGVVTTAAVISPHVSIRDSEIFFPDPIIQSPTPTPEERMILALAVTPKPTKIPVPSPTAVVLASESSSSTPTPIQKPPVAQAGIPYDEYFTKYAGQFAVNKELLVHIARCESGFRPGAVNGEYLGMYQYLASTWQSTRRAMGENPDPSLRANPEEAIKTSAWKIANGGIGAWPICGRS
jgi:hypothetical protein